MTGSGLGPSIRLLYQYQAYVILAKLTKFIECVATCFLCFLSGLIGITLAGFETSQTPAYVGVINVFLLTLFIMASGPGSGGHINPMITLATMTTGLTGFSRGMVTRSLHLPVGIYTDCCSRSDVYCGPSRRSCTGWWITEGKYGRVSDCGVRTVLVYR